MKRITLVIIVYTLCALTFTQCWLNNKNKETAMVTFTDHSIQSQFMATPDESINFKQAEAHSDYWLFYKVQ